MCSLMQKKLLQLKPPNLLKKEENLNEDTVKKREENAPKDDNAGCSDRIDYSNMIINEDLKAAARKARDNEQRRRKVEEMRNRLHDDDDILEIHSEQSSLESSSVEGIYPNSNRNYTFKHSDRNSNETSSVMSLGKIGSILGGRDKQSSKDMDAISTDSKYSCNEGGSLQDYAGMSVQQRSNCSEPDVVASTKGDFKHPVAPPRRKKKSKNASKTSAMPVTDVNLPSPTDPVESLAREIEYSLDLHSATRGQYVVKPQDREQDRAEGPSSDDVERRNSLPHRSESLSSISSSNLLNPIEAHETANCSNEENKQQPYIVRTRSDSGRPLTDQEILEQVTVRNLDTGEQIPLSLAEEHLPRCLNPLSLHIMRLTSEYVSNTALNKESDEESTEARKSDVMDLGAKAWVRTRVTHSRHGDEDNSEEEIISDQRSSVKIKSSSKLKSAEKGGSEFENIRVIQEINGEHTGAIWTMKFSTCGRLLATAGQDHDLRIWVLKDAYKYFDDMRQKFNAESGKTSPVPSQPEVNADIGDDKEDSEEDKGPFVRKPFCTYQGHTAELLDVSWSKNYFYIIIFYG
ncbi:hypothetical protein CEXT_142371 [Caerostris extrusa]|uniref:WD repeat-containing protein 44 n=1 Tax=Caerostris extrusa TaxID=172846 RepID=A0AAV4VDJ4_CAEEX|nr:hypothetical protein CEXT_142371 [Caerostris extrusa]